MHITFPDDFHQSEVNQPHPERSRFIMKRHPEIAQLMGRNPFTFAILLFVVGLQISIAIFMGSMGIAYWWLSLLVAYCVGAFANHSLFVVIHDATHDLIFKSRTANKLAAIFADLTNIVPNSMGFRIYHQKHHAHQGDHEFDADMASDWEARLIRNIWWRKALWLLFFPIFQVLRIPRLAEIKIGNAWSVLNVIAVLSFDIAICYFFGMNAFLYLVASFTFSVGLHPLGARWIQEHFTPNGEQETFSYYGPLNTVALNVGFHNEHHDFPAVPWNRLPEIRRIAPEYYNSLQYHTSWVKLVLKFIFNPEYSLYSRVERTKDGKVAYERQRKTAQANQSTATVVL
jgi:sphingolipid delta-4 desaturase